MSIYCLIPARGGSKRIKNKNLLKLKGKPLINHTIKHALNSKKINKIFVSTDEEKIIKILPKNIYVIKRPINLSGDSVSTEEVIFHFLNKLKKEKMKAQKYIVLLQCTSPFIEKNDIDKSISLLISKKYDSVFSGAVNKNLFWVKKKQLKPINYIPKRRLTEQKMRAQYIENGSIYVFKTKGFIKSKCRLFGKIGIHLMSKKNSHQLDDLEDLKIIKKLYV